tara:strand:- start:107 stop:457 length:351 start_codon:yes stop_codon:yes gene_type:complete
MATISKQPISGAANGLGVKVAATGSAGTTIHTAVAGGVDWDEVWLYATNTNTTAETLVLQWGGTTAIDNEIRAVIQASETVLVSPGLILRNGLVIKAYSTTANKVTIHGFVNQLDV